MDRYWGALKSSVLIRPQQLQAKEELKPDATAVFVAAPFAAAAIEEAIAAEIPLIVAVAEHIPVHDMLRVCVVTVSRLQPSY